MTTSEKKRGQKRSNRKKQQKLIADFHKGQRLAGGQILPKTPGRVEGEGIDLGEISYRKYE